MDECIKMKLNTTNTNIYRGNLGTMLHLLVTRMSMKMMSETNIKNVYLKNIAEAVYFWIIGA